MDYNIFKICRTLKGENANIYKQRTTTGIKCCTYPSIENLYLLNDYNSSFPGSSIIINDINNVENYLKVYQLLNTTTYDINMECNYFKDTTNNPPLFDTDFIIKSSEASTLLSGTCYSDLQIKENYPDLYNYVEFQLNILKGITDVDNNVLNVPNYTKNTVSCSTGVPKYIKYSMLDYMENPNYISFCQENQQNSLNNKVVNMEYSIHSFSKENGKSCDTSTCTFESYPPFAGSYVGKKTYHSKYKQISQDFYKQWWFILTIVLVGVIIIGIIIYIIHSKRIKLKREVNEKQQNIQ